MESVGEFIKGESDPCLEAASHVDARSGRGGMYYIEHESIGVLLGLKQG